MNQNTKDPEARIEELLQTGDKKQAIDLLYKLSLISARKNDYKKAEAYRDRLYEADSGSMAKIVKINAAIDNAKNSNITPVQRRLWSRLFEVLNPQEANALFSALKAMTCESGAVILNQGQPNDRLYLISRGEFSQLYKDRDKEILIQGLTSGDIFGEDTFFSVNVCTVTVKALTTAEVSYIGRPVLDELQKVHHALGLKLKKACGSGKTTVAHHVLSRGIDRRSFKRVNFNIGITFQLLNANSAKAAQRSVRAELWDISKGGLSFYFESNNSAAVRNLIGCSVGVRFNLQVAGKAKAVALTGIVQGVQSHPFDEYSVHLRFHRPLTDAAMKNIERLALE